MTSIRRHLTILMLGVALTLVGAPVAGAYWENYGWVPNGYDTSCIWYPSYARCSGWNKWQFMEGIVYSGGPVLVGFENYQHIRGVYTYAGDRRTLDPYTVGMCCYLIAHGTNTAVPAWAELWAAT